MTSKMEGFGVIDTMVCLYQPDLREVRLYGKTNGIFCKAAKN